MRDVSKSNRVRVREPLSNISVVLFIVLFAANFLAVLPAVLRPTGARLDHLDPAPYIAPTVLYAIVVAVSAVTLRRRRSSGWTWIRWVLLPGVALALCVLSMPALWFSIPLAIYAGVLLFGQVVILGRYGYTGYDNPLG